MEIKVLSEGNKLTVAPIGRIDTITAPEVEAKLKLDGVETLVVDLSNVEYVSSAGLRVMLAAQKKMHGKSMTIVGVHPAVKEVFDITGFSDIFTFA